MVHFLNNDTICFPPVEEANEDGLLAIGGNLTASWLLEAYTHGIFPWFNSDRSEILWWSPDPRFVLFPQELKIHRSLKQVMKKKIFTVSFDTAFKQVISECSKPRKQALGTWITARMKSAYIKLHELGFAHSVEVWHNGQLAGGLYGVSLGNAFFGESMFTLMDNASKIALVTLVTVLRRLEFALIDCQVYTDNLKHFGARFIPRDEFIRLLTMSSGYTTLCGSWSHLVADDYDYMQCIIEVNA
ncbi:MAG: leucyl/phenylalanyl-tRNA--protein transferase [Spirochaetes bacterium]|nr:leucyl/phenylalanyl-tRNA--protein transferase [Spirochaetota bacterium]